MPVSTRFAYGQSHSCVYTAAPRRTIIPIKTASTLASILSTGVHWSLGTEVHRSLGAEVHRAILLAPSNPRDKHS